MFSTQINLSNIKLCLATSALLFLGCSSDGAPEQEPLGNVEMNLVGQGASGDTYRLRYGYIVVENSEASVLFETESDPDLSSLTATVPIGYYNSYLESGWYLERLYPDGTALFVTAYLTSPNPVGVSVLANQNTQIELRFRTADDEVVFDNGSFEIVLAVEEVSPLLFECPNYEFGPIRECGWSLAPGFEGASCNPGEDVLVGCGCSGGTCSGDPMIRVCEGSEPCSAGAALALVDNGCGWCPEGSFTCPESGTYTVLVGSYGSTSGFLCTPVTNP